MFLAARAQAGSSSFAERATRRRHQMKTDTMWFTFVLKLHFKILPIMLPSEKNEVTGLEGVVEPSEA